MVETFCIYFSFCSFEHVRLKVYFKETQFITSKRSELYGQTDFFGNCGGLLGLFLGVSVISLLEIVYFFTIRLFFNLKSEVPVFSYQNNGAEKDNSKHSFFKIAKDLVADYSTKTSIQGLNYIADTSLTLFERLWWLVIFVVSVFCCGLFIFDVFQRYDSSPIIVSLAETETLISSVSTIGYFVVK
jgi:hypothetical protein